MFKSTATHDVFFKTSDGDRVGAHKAVLIAASPVFHAMIKDGTEIQSAYTSTVITSLFTFVYTGVMDAYDDEDVDVYINLLMAAHFFGLQRLQQLCTDALLIHVDNFCQIATMAVERNLVDLNDKCFSFMEENTSKIVIMPTFKYLPLSVMTSLLQSDELQVKEIQLFLAVVGWLNQQLRNGVADHQIMSLIRYPLMELKDLEDVVRPTNIYDVELFKAAVSYRESDVYNGPPTQLRVRGHYFHFEELGGDFSVTYTAKGTILSRMNVYGKSGIRCEVSDVSQPLLFKCAVTRTNHDAGELMKSSVSLELSVQLYLDEDHRLLRVSSLPYENEIYGEIAVKREQITDHEVSCKFGTDAVVKCYRSRSMIVCIDINIGRRGDEVRIVRL